MHYNTAVHVHKLYSAITLEQVVLRSQGWQFYPSLLLSIKRYLIEQCTELNCSQRSGQYLGAFLPAFSVMM